MLDFLGESEEEEYECLAPPSGAEANTSIRMAS